MMKVYIETTRGNLVGEIDKEFDEVKIQDILVCVRLKYPEGNLTVIDWNPYTDILDACNEEYQEDICQSCPYRNFTLVSHPGGSSYHSAKKYFCDQGFWEDNF